MSCQSIFSSIAFALFLASSNVFPIQVAFKTLPPFESILLSFEIVHLFKSCSLSFFFKLSIFFISVRVLYFSLYPFDESTTVNHGFSLHSIFIV